MNTMNRTLRCPYCDGLYRACACARDRRVSYDLVRCDVEYVAQLVREHHPYRSVGGVSAVDVFAVVEEGKPVAAYIWRVPPPGSALAVAPGAHHGALALSRMVAVPRDERRLNHVGKPLRAQKKLLDRGRWPVLVTYSDASCGHTGHVYRCSGWQKDAENETIFCEDEEGRRVSRYSNGRTLDIEVAGKTTITRWVDRSCLKGEEAEHMAAAGWEVRPVPGKTWRSGNQAYAVVKRDEYTSQIALFEKGN